MKAEDLVRQIEEKLGTLADIRPEVANIGRVVNVADGIVRADGLEEQRPDIDTDSSHVDV